MVRGHLGEVLNHIRCLVGPDGDSAATDAQLLERFRSLREEASFAALVRRHGSLVFGVCRRVLDDDHDAEDAFQATFLVLARKAGSIRKQQSLGSWLFGVAYRIAARARSKAARQRLREQEKIAIPPSDPVVDLIWRELRPVLDEELNRLPLKYRHPLVLCYLENKTNREAARQLGWTKGTLSGRLARARELLRARLTRRGLTLSAGVLAAALGQNAAASIPSALGMSTVKAAALVIVTGQAAGAVSGPVAALMKGAVQAMLVTKIKITAAVLLAVGILGTGTALLGQRLLAQGGGSDGAGERVPVNAAADVKPKKAEDPAKLKKEIERLKKELTLARKKLEDLQRLIKAQREEALLAQAEAKVAQAQAEAARVEAQRQRKLALQQEQRARAEAERARAQAALARRQAEDQRAQAREARARAISAKNLRQIGVAMLDYSDTFKSFPAHAIYGKNGKALLSWRVAILPFIQQDALYKEFKLDEPWDSAHNKKLLARMPAIYASVGNTAAKKYSTFYQVFVGKGTMFEGKKGLKLAQITDGTANTIAVVEAGKAVPWSKPDDLSYQPGKPLPKLGGLFKNGFHILLADSSVRFVSSKFNDKKMRLAITRNGGQEVDVGKLDKE